MRSSLVEKKTFTLGQKPTGGTIVILCVDAAGNQQGSHSKFKIFASMCRFVFFKTDMKSPKNYGDSTPAHTKQRQEISAI